MEKKKICPDCGRIMEKLQLFNSIADYCPCQEPSTEKTEPSIELDEPDQLDLFDEIDLDLPDTIDDSRSLELRDFYISYYDTKHDLCRSIYENFSLKVGQTLHVKQDHPDNTPRIWVTND
jgi:hypothetical protein